MRMNMNVGLDQILKDSRELCVTAKQLREAARAIQSKSKEVRSMRGAFNYKSYQISSSKLAVVWVKGSTSH